MARLRDPHLQFGNTLDRTFQHIAALDRTDAGRRTGENEIARLQFEESGEKGDHLRHFPNHLREIAILLQRAVDKQPHRSPPRMADSARRNDLRTGRRVWCKCSPGQDCKLPGRADKTSSSDP